jgi:hypothetical protein
MGMDFRPAVVVYQVAKFLVERYGKQMVGNVWFYLPTARESRIRDTLLNAISLTNGQGKAKKLYLLDGGPDGSGTISKQNQGIGFLPEGSIGLGKKNRNGNF